MDNKVILTMVATIVLAFGMIGFKAITKKECVQPVITFEPSNPTPGQPVKFTVNYKGME